MRKCEYCGSYLADSDTACPGCGAKCEPIEQPTVGDFVRRAEKKLSDKRVVNALVLLILTAALGFLGVHRFKQRKIFTGIIWLFTFGLFTVGWAVDGIINLVNFIHALTGSGQHKQE